MRCNWRFATAFAYCVEVIDPVDSIACSTSSRRWIASCGRWNGSKREGACGRPARSAACGSVSREACFEKYVCAAASIP